MSNSASRLRKILKTQKTAKLSPQNTPKLGSALPISIKALAEELDLDELAKKINHNATLSSKFRSRHNIYDFTIARLANAKRYNLIEDILDTHKHFQDISREGYALRLVSLYAKAGMFDHALKLFDELPELGCPRTVKSFNALLKAAVESKRFDEVFTLFQEVPADLGISCDVVSYNTLIHALCEVGKLDEGLLMIDEMRAKGVSPSVVTFNTLLGAFYRERGFEGGELIWGIMDEYDVVRDVRSYNLKLQGLVDEGELEKAVALFESLESEGCKPDVGTFNVFIKKYCDEGDIEEAKRWYYVLLESCVPPNSITFSYLVPKFCDDGEYELAFELCKKMFKRQFVVDEALLQLVINGLVKESKIQEAEELVELGKSNSFVQYGLVIPSDNTEKQEQNNSL
ncbi:pentatricopeptide repeat-containing protein At1g55890, mitochondrial-like [Chenopodium quinoa]|uniref:pentatricopeptide repeat-containing protein At1g55890, mitochondrial-like n=1 Tax=Chenopodium quinoa TaxID=63459 RepID=UPI000B789B86|nr:pentatricopeptide repeat-containing protein At1g55890, mitochondrial-like [Chenopodium quinoa]